ncbi:Nif11-like leader peptide family natural product precursor [Actinomadura atramentaria]|uniref:Nif11-like leader peptide family natural product precursor n=1 Tax=Actinomadura atramentaria TaxID=1990 RepID=UPI000361EDC2|nr:Nif11-like leader peptide family natural product precursor [Actinomadura atramentaria]
MSVESCAAFLRVVNDDARLRQQLKALTGVAEMIRLGEAHGFRFDGRDLATASASVVPPPAAPPASRAPEPEPEPAAEFLHHEYDLDALAAAHPGFATVLAEFPRLKVRPSDVDLAAFDAEFRPGDLRSTELAPRGEEYRRWAAELAATARPGDRRDFHLVNLDDHVGHADYDDYLDAKTRVVGALEDVFGAEVRFSGSMWYPPSSYRLWHTNETQPGWRMYLIDLDDDFEDAEHTSFFRYQHPETGELVTLRERRRMARFFRIEQRPDRLFWHCIVNPTRRHRWSFGFAVPDSWTAALAGLA